MNREEMIEKLYAFTEKEKRLAKDPAYSDYSFYEQLEKKGCLRNGVYYLPSIRIDTPAPSGVLNTAAEMIDASPYQMLFRMKKATRFQQEPFISTNFLAIRYVYSGSVNMATPSSEFVLHENDILLMNTGFVHSQNLPHENDIVLTLMFEKDYLTKYVTEFSAGSNVISRFIYNYVLDNKDPGNYVIFHGRDNRKLKQVMEDFILEYIQPTELGDILLRAYIQILLVEMMHSEYEYEHTSRSHAYMTTAQILDDISQNYQTVTLQSLSEKYGYHADYISRQIKAVTGMNFKDYLFEKKIQEAALLLKNTDLPIREICEQTGFSSETMFYKKFQNSFFISPAQYRNEI